MTPHTTEGTNPAHPSDADAARFVPIKAAHYWEVLEPVVVAAVSKTTRRTGRQPRSLYPVATAFVLWAWQSKGIELEVGRMFRRRIVEEFVHRGMSSYTRGSRATYRSTLIAIVDAVTPPSEQPFPIPRSDPTPPYTPSEIAALRSWANSQGSSTRRQDAAVLLALGFGGGLATRELLALRVSDVDVRPHSVHVLVWDRRPRLVPILPAWDSALRGAVGDADPDVWLFRRGRTGVRPGQVTDFLHRGHTTELDVRPARMRTTWMLTHLQSGTPPRELLRIAGLENLAALDRLTPFLPARAPIPADAAAPDLRTD
jgi:integrase